MSAGSAVAAYRGVASVGAAAPDGIPPGEWPAVVRFSRGAWLPFAGVHVHQRLDPEEERALDLDPYHTGPNLVPSGLLNRLRRPAYGGSREGRGAP